MDQTEPASTGAPADDVSSEEPARRRRQVSLWQRWKQTSIHNKALVWTSGLVAFGTLFYAGAVAWQVLLMNRTARDAAQQADRLVAATNAAIDQATQHSSDSLRSAIEEEKAALGSALQQSNAALQAGTSQSKAALDASIAASRLEQRAWLAITDVTLAAEPDETSKEATVTAIISNTGRTPVLDMIIKYRLFITDHEPPATDWSKLPGDKHNLLFAGAKTTELKATAPLVPSLVTSYRSGRTNLFIHLRVDYTDVFQIQHWTSVFMSHAFGHSAAFLYCPNPGEIDTHSENQTPHSDK